MMSRALLFPLMVMLILSFISFTTDGDLTSDYGVETNNTVTVNGTETTYSTSQGGTFDFNLFVSEGFIVTVIAVTAIVILLGIQVFSTGMSPYSQMMIMKSVGFLGLWAILSLMSSNLIVSGTGVYGILIYAGLTVLYGIGYLNEISLSGG